MGNNLLYNPWSVINYLEFLIIKPYWINTGEIDLLENLFSTMNFDNLKE